MQKLWIFMLLKEKKVWRQKTLQVLVEFQCKAVNVKLTKTSTLTYMLEQMDFTYLSIYLSIAYSVQEQQNTDSSQVLMEHSPRQILCQAAKQIFVNLRRLKPYRASFSDHRGLKLEINYKKNSRKFTNMWRLTTCYLTKESKKKSKEKKLNVLETNKNGSTTYQNLQDAAKAVLRKFIEINPQETRKISNNHFIPEGTRKKSSKLIKGRK